MRGEKKNFNDFLCSVVGSPPHARGKALPADNVGDLLGITPACAGKRDPDCGVRKWKQDHPRMRGEKITTAKADKLEMGSPPHARGKAPHQRS